MGGGGMVLIVSEKQNVAKPLEKDFTAQHGSFPPSNATNVRRCDIGVQRTYTGDANIVGG